MRLFGRAFNRGKIPVEFSQGFNPHPKFSIASPISLGIESEEEYMDIELVEDMSLDEFKEKLNSALPKDIQITDVIKAKNKKTIASMITWAKYKVVVKPEEPIDVKKVEDSLLNWTNRDEIIIERLRKKKKQKVLKRENIIELIDDFKIIDIKEDRVEIEAILKTGSNQNLRPFDFVKAMMRDNYLKGDLDIADIKRKKLYIGDKSEVF